MAGHITLADLPLEIREKLGLAPAGGGKAPKRRKMSTDDVRGYALRCLAPLAALSKSERTRVLKHALKVNEV